jgi:hypothetical protein
VTAEQALQGKPLSVDEHHGNQPIEQFWGNTPAASDPAVWDEEIRVVNAMQPRVVPPWAWQVLTDLPSWGFEFCNQNWLSGLDECVAAIGIREPRPRSFGSCGNTHPSVRVTIKVD